MKILLTLCLALTATSVDARSARHHPPAAQDSYVGPGAEIFDATERAQREPGLTSELDPSARQTATGGPSGGIPGFSGH